MTPVTLDSGEYLMVRVPEDASDIRMQVNYFKKETPQMVCYNIYLPNDGTLTFMPINERYVELPSGNYSLIGRASELTDEQWSGIVRPIESDFYYDYFMDFYRCETRAESGSSLMFHHGMKPNCVILKKQ